MSGQKDKTTKRGRKSLTTGTSKKIEFRADQETINILELKDNRSKFIRKAIAHYEAYLWEDDSVIVSRQNKNSHDEQPIMSGQKEIVSGQKDGRMVKVSGQPKITEQDRVELKEDYLRTLSRDELREICRKKGIKIKGTPRVLVGRIVAGTAGEKQ